MSPTRRILGAYGFQLVGDDLPAHLLAEVPAGWPLLTISQVEDREGGAEYVLGDAEAVVPLLPAGSAHLDLDRRTAEFRMPERISEEALIHPYLAPAAAVHAHWLGRESYHAAGVLIDGRGWGVAGAREVGKSTLVAALAHRGYPVMADDLLVIDGTMALVGPRTVDLREAAAARLGGSRHLGTTGMRQRWRVDLEDAPSMAEFTGWIFPGWSRSVGVETMTAAERLALPASHRALRHRPPAPEHAMWMAGRQAVAFGRPQDWDRFDDGIDELLATISA